MPTRIAFCITDLDPGGAETNLCRLVLGLTRARWKPAVFCLQAPGPLAEELVRQGIRVESVQARHRWDVRALGRLTRALQRFRPRVLQTFLFHANLAGRIAGRLGGVPVIVCGARVAERRSRWPLVADALTRALADHTVCVSRGVARWIQRRSHWPRTRLSVIPNGIPASAFAPTAAADLKSLGLPRDARCLLFVGRLDAQKGLTHLLDALALLAPRLGSLHLLLAGEGPARDALQRQAAELRLLGRVHFLGSRQDVPALMRAAQLLVLPSLWEGMPNVVLEAMAAGLPVVMSQVEGSEELIVPGETGLLVPPGDGAALAAALWEALQHPGNLARLAARARERVAARFSAESMVAAYEGLYERLLAGKGGETGAIEREWETARGFRAWLVRAVLGGDG